MLVPPQPLENSLGFEFLFPVLGTSISKHLALAQIVQLSLSNDPVPVQLVPILKLAFVYAPGRRTFSKLFM